MNGSRHEAITHVLALVAVAVVLILAAAFIASSVSAPSRSSQTAVATHSVASPAEVPVPIPIPKPNPLIKPLTDEERKTAIEKKCEELKPLGLTGELEQKFTGNTIEGHQCVAIIRKLGKPECVGKESIVMWNFKGTGTIVSRAAPLLPMGICQTKFCDIATGKCGPERTVAGSQSVTEWAQDPVIFSNLKTSEQQIIASNLDKATADVLNRSLTAEAKDLDYQITDAIKARDDAQQTLARFAEGCVSLECRDERVVVATNLQRTEQELVALETQKDWLAAAKVTLAPNVRDDKITVPPPPPPYNPDTFPRDLGGGPLGGAGGLGQLLQGLMKGLQGGQQGQGGAPPPGNKNPQTPGTCAPQLVCTNNTLYSRNSQCVDVPMQQCPHGCTGNACNQPPGAPTAQLSCQPQVADPGMTIAITWGCSAGVSTASGFSTGGALSGATSMAVSAPSGSTNTVAFGLVCSNQSLSSSASCTVQVAKPAIVLVANPDSVPLNDKATIGWVTSGMEKCTVSSPDQLDFTERNASRTNINGVAEMSPITETTDILLTCTTLGGNVREATSTVTVLGEEGSE